MKTLLLLLAQIVTSQYNNARTGSNTAETILNPRNVNATQFGRVFRFTVDGDVYAQPLYLPAVQIPGKGQHDVVFIATEHDSVYAFDASGHPAEPLWQVGFANPRAGITAVPQSEIGCPFIAPEIGITSTPVIDAQAGTLYVLARTSEQGADRRPRYFQRLHALDIATGAERPGSPVLIRASVDGKSAGFLSLFNGALDFNSYVENPRAALLLAGHTLFLTWASACDMGPYHGWVIAYDAKSLRQTGVFNTSPDSTESGIWAGDTGPAADSAGNIYLATGNGKFDAASGGRDYGDSLIKLHSDSGGLTVRDYFTPYDEGHLNSTDKDLGSGGVVLLPDQSGRHPHLAAVAGKGATLYLVDRDHLGKYHAGNNSHAVGTVTLKSDVFGAPAYWNGKLYILSEGDVLKAFSVANGQLSPAPVAQTRAQLRRSATPEVSANGDREGIVWIIDSEHSDERAVLHAWDANDLSRELYNSLQNPSRDAAGRAPHFTIPTIAAGRVYVGAKGEVDVYGLLVEPGQRPSGRGVARTARSKAHPRM